MQTSRPAPCRCDRRFQLSAPVLFAIFGLLGASLGSRAPAQNQPFHQDESPSIAPANRPELVVTGKPYEAERTLHTRRSLADGTLSTSDSIIRDARDSSGRLVTETESESPATADHPAHQYFFTIVLDPVSRTILTWTSEGKTGTLIHFPPSRTLDELSPPNPQDQPIVLGHRVILGLLCTGYRIHTIIPAGTLGNETATSTTHEWWVDEELHIKALETFDDPQHGLRTIELISLKRVEPDPSRFHLPAGYSVNEIGRPNAALGAVPSSEQPLDLAHAPSMTPDDAFAMLDSQDIQKRREGAAALAKAAQASSDPVFKDKVAYQLARANVGLDEAESLSEFAVNQAENDCSGQTAPVMDRSAFSSEISLARYWDTLGYIHDRKGETRVAKNYLQSAWELDPRAYYGSHLARLDEEAGETKDAISVYRSALDAPGGDDLKATLRERVRALAGDSAKQTVLPDEALAGTAANLSGMAFFDLSYSSAAGPSAVFVSGDDSLRALIPAVAHQEQAAFALPDRGPERVVRRYQVICGAQPVGSPACTIRALGAQEARALLRP